MDPEEERAEIDRRIGVLIPDVAIGCAFERDPEPSSWWSLSDRRIHSLGLNKSAGLAIDPSACGSLCDDGTVVTGSG
jgi:hypothetical protein